ncbi:dihydroxyacetone kinase subunit DhaK [Micromonospora sp. R77]|uniref:dihydroxyacetone kinase subunit DhaK n=1 Tax=Micromonospora sp. R77 TaxID=2925836 RepID=UPI001F61D492|nr:dihydroxyacetone kinase subunit DhaK [Micromonospora sp. R77]MCI4065154.1 dihydroxyacetone kinase subunit DhaK [Micromonospora sp. R77]
MSRRQFVNDPEHVVPEALEGYVLAHPGLLHLHPDPAYVTRAKPAGDKVALVSGGGSGHEPLHVGFVGTGMLDAAVPGAVFASPTALQVAAATTAVDTGRGVLHIVKNYTGDVLNFRIAAEIAADDGIEVEQVLVDDDLASERADGEGPGRRGTAAVVVVEKLCGALAERGATLADVATFGRTLVGQARSMGVALAAGAHPGDSEPAWLLAADEVELGVGIHGERGVGRRPFAGADELAADLLDRLVGALGLARGDDVLVVVNGLGATHGLELALVHRAVHHQLAGRGVRVARSLVGPYVTSLDMAGLSITLVRADDERVALWDAPVRTPALTW